MFHGFPSKNVTWVAGKSMKKMNITIIQSCIMTMQVGDRTHAHECTHCSFFANSEKSDPRNMKSTRCGLTDTAECRQTIIIARIQIIYLQL